MYQDQDSIKVFERMHARDQLVRLARNIGRNGDDLDLFAAHTRSERREGLIGKMLIVALALAVLLGSVALLGLS